MGLYYSTLFWFQPVPEDQPDIDPIGRPIVHCSAYQQTSGEAVFVDDSSLVQGEFHSVRIK